MKIINCFILLFVFTIGVVAQGEIVLNQANLREKQNHILRGLPKILLHAFCAGELPGYYPNNTKAQVSFTEMLNYAYMADPTYFNNRLRCPHEFCYLSKENLFKFQHQIELLEYQQESAIGKEPSTTTHYVRLKILHNKKYYNGPVFFLRDILKLENKYKLYNPNNDAAPLSLKKLFLARMFNAKQLKNYSNPNKRKISPTKVKDDDLYEY